MRRIKILYGRNLEEIARVPERNSHRWIDVYLNPLTWGRKECIRALYALRGEGYYDLFVFDGYAAIKRFDVLKIWREGSKLKFKKIRSVREALLENGWR
jgi:hypothetical protein